MSIYTKFMGNSAKIMHHNIVVAIPIQPSRLLKSQSLYFVLKQITLTIGGKYHCMAHLLVWIRQKK